MKKRRGKVYRSSWNSVRQEPIGSYSGQKADSTTYLVLIVWILGAKMEISQAQLNIKFCLSVLCTWMVLWFLVCLLVLLQTWEPRQKWGSGSVKCMNDG